MEDKRNILRDDQPFSYKEIKDGKYQILFNGKSIKIIQGKESAKLRRFLASDDPYQIQLFLAKVTGQFKHGNERQAKGN